LQELPSGCKNPADPNFPVQHPTLLELKTIDEEFEQLFGKLADTPVQVSATADMPTGGGSVLGEEVIGGFTENWGTNSVV
jgi:hypothetical protein